MNKLFFGDNLDVLRRHIKDESVDLVYLDPPFNSKANYNVLFKERGDRPSEAQAEAFRDTWSWGPSAAIAYDDLVKAGGSLSGLMVSLRNWLGDTGMMAYLVMMGVRLVELHRAMKETGSIYLHCDPTASHYIKIIMDGIFGHQNFRSEIIWRRSASHNKITRQYGPIHDVILFYTKSAKFIFHPGRTPYTKAYITKMFRFKDERGPYRQNELTGAGTRKGESGKPWLNYNPTARNRHWAIPASLREALPNDGDGMTPQQMLDCLAKNGDIIISPEGRPTYKQRMGTGVPYQDIWAYQPGTAGVLTQSDYEIDQDVKWLDGEDERLGYPTQKPLGLLERILNTSTDEGSVVLDPFCGCGTTVEAAERLHREWAGIDVTHYAVTLIEKRLKAYRGAKFEVVGRPTDLAGAQDLARRDKYQFQWWASWRLGAQTYETKKGADRGIDGNIYFLNGPYGYGRIIVSVKGGEQITPSMVRDLAGVVDREKAEMGVLITLVEPTKAMSAEAAGHGFVSKSAHGRLSKIKIITVQDLLDDRVNGLPPIPHAIEQPRRKSAKDRDQLELLFPYEGDGLQTQSGAFVDPAWINPTRRKRG